MTSCIEESKMRSGVEGRRRVFEEFSAEYYALCSLGGMLSAGATHLAITPLDVFKVNMQGIQGGCRFGLYEYFKKLYSDVLINQNKSTVFFLSSASTQVFADVALCPFEAVKVCVQTQPFYAKGMVDGFPKLYSTEGLAGFYKGLLPLWGRNLPFAMMMFTTFEHSVDLVYHKVIHKTKEDCSIVQQLGVTCLAGYAAGAVGTVVSNPADNIVSSLYNKKAYSVMQAVRNIGFANLFTRSLPVRITLVGPVITLQWFLYDTIKVLSGLPPSGGLTRRLEEANISG